MTRIAKYIKRIAAPTVSAAIVITALSIAAPTTGRPAVAAPAGQQIVACAYYLSHGAMLAAADANIPAAPAFCAVSAN